MLTNTSKHEIHKTGLGSSAAMVASLIASILAHFGMVDLQYDGETIDLSQATESDKELIHRVAQFCHCLAQGKIGSGFDVSSATFGSQKYTRFDPSILELLLQTSINNMEKKKDSKLYALTCDKKQYQCLLDTIELNNLLHHSKFNSRWDTKHVPFQLPPLFHLFVADVDQGSNTPNMVRSVLKWREENKEEALQMWTKIDSLNLHIEVKFNELTTLSKRNMKEYRFALDCLSRVSSNEWSKFENGNNLFVSIRQNMLDLRQTFIKIRLLLKRMGKLAYDVPIEPDQQTQLLDATMDVPGCLIAGVPGAGGFDAIFSILFGDEKKVKTDVAKLWLKYQGASVCPLVLNESLSKGVVKSKEEAIWPK